MNLVVKPSAAAQLAALPRIAQLAVDDALQLLLLAPHIGVKMEDHLGGVFYQKLAVVLRRRWTLHIVYQLRGDDLLVEYIDPSWLKRTSV
jgi:hypothetical protein